MADQPFPWRDDIFHYPPLPSLIIAYPKQQHRSDAHKRDDNNVNDNNVDLRSPINDLDDNLLELIFTRLVQWRYLDTCKCVSKRWNSIISNPDFTRYLTNKYIPFTLILRQGWTDNCLITEHPYFQTHNLRLDFIIPNRIVANHNDILVLCRPLSWYKFLSVELAYYIANPLTKQFIVVPAVTCDYVAPYNITFESWAVGFAGVVSGVSTIDVPSSMGFRIIHINTPDPNILIFQIYSSESGKWTTYSDNNLGFELRSHDIFDGRNQAVTFNNRVHWRGQDNKILVIDPFVDHSIEPDWVLNLPNEIHEGSVLESCRNKLRISQFDDNPPRIKIWEFEDYDDLITLEVGGKSTLRLVTDFILEPNVIDSVFPAIDRLFPALFDRSNEVICCHPNDPDIVYIIYQDKLLECDLINNRLKVIRHCRTTWSERFILMAP